MHHDQTHGKTSKHDHVPQNGCAWRVINDNLGAKVIKAPAYTKDCLRVALKHCSTATRTTTTGGTRVYAPLTVLVVSSPLRCNDVPPRCCTTDEQLEGHCAKIFLSGSVPAREKPGLLADALQMTFTSQLYQPITERNDQPNLKKRVA